jgi:ATP-binding cassette subfamily F protein 3
VPSLSLIDTVNDLCPETATEHKAALIRSGFPYPTHINRVSVLSGGERAHLMFLTINLNRPNFLILDEPTNHIDIEGKGQLEAQVLASGATVLLTSHDRRFVDTIANRYVVIAGDRLVEVHNPEHFYTSFSRQTTRVGQAKPTDDADPSLDTLDRIIELDRLLAEDLARKPKFQKPARQAEWQRELDLLNECCDATTRMTLPAGAARRRPLTRARKFREDRAFGN